MANLNDLLESTNIPSIRNWSKEDCERHINYAMGALQRNFQEVMDKVYNTNGSIDSIHAVILLNSDLTRFISELIEYSNKVNPITTGQQLKAMYQKEVDNGKINLDGEY